MLKTFSSKVIIPLIVLTLSIVLYILFVWCPVSVERSLEFIEGHNQKTLRVLANKISTPSENWNDVVRENFDDIYNTHLDDWLYLKLISPDNVDVYALGITDYTIDSKLNRKILTENVTINNGLYRLEVLYDYTALRTEVESHAAQLAISIFISFLIFSIILWVIIHVLIIKPIRKLGNAAINMGQGKNIPLAIDGGAEAQLLIKQFLFMRKKIVASNKMKDNFISTVSHELRTPMTSIHGSLSLLNSNLENSTSEAMKDLTAIAFRNSKHLTMLINDILETQSLDGSYMEFKFENHSTKTLIEDSIALNKGYADQFLVNLELEKIDDIDIKIDPRRMMQVVSNILSNAIKCSDEHSSVTLSGYMKDKTIFRIEVKDQGPGMTESVQKNLFKKFFNKDTKKLQEVSGTGLGLYISKKIMEQHKGKISFETKLGKGTKFYIDLPIM